MSGLMDYTHYLAKVIGPRPTGTEEEQQAALYVTEQFQRETGFSSNIEEFKRTTNPDLSYAILGSAIALVSLLSIFLPALSIATFIVIVLIAAVYVLETFGHPLLSKALAKGESQNVIAKYQPNVDGGHSVSRKLILVAHYDTGHVTPGPVKTLDSFKVAFNVMESGVMAVLAFLALIRIFIAITGGGALIILNVVTVIVMLLALLPLLRFVLINNAPYNEGANNNASGTATLIEIARRISHGSVSENDLLGMNENVVVHGADAALEAGLIPEGATLSYEAQETRMRDVSKEPLDESSEEDRLLAAKAAIAALTGRPVENKLYVTPQTTPGAGGMAQSAEPLTGDVDLTADGNAIEVEKIETVPTGITDDALPNDSVMVEADTPNAVVQSDLVESPVEVQSELAPAQEEFSVSAYFAAANANNNGAAVPLPAVTPAASAVSVAAAAPVEVIAVSDEGSIEATPATSEVVQEASLSTTSEPVSDAVAVVETAVATTSLTAEENTSVAGFQNVPSWFAAAQKNAKRSDTQTEIQRSRYTEAIEHAELERIEREMAELATEAARLEAERKEREAEARARIEAQQREIEEAREAHETAAQAEAQVEEAQTAVTQVEEQIAAEAPIPGVDEAIAAPQVDLLQEALDYKAAQEASSIAAHVPEIQVPPVVSTEAVTAAAQAAVSHQDRLSNLRTNVPSLSGVIRTKDAARRAAVESLSNKLSTTDISSQNTSAIPTVAASETVAIPAGAVSQAPVEPAPLRNAPASRNLQAVIGGRSLSAIPSPADPAAPAYSEQSVDYNMVVSDYGNDFGGYEDDFASNLFNEDDYDNSLGADYSSDYGYDEYDNAFLNDEDFAPEAAPKRKGFFSRFLHKEEEVMESPQQWLGVDDDFDARSVGRARGGWESFRQEDYDDLDDPFNDDGYDDFGDFGDDLRQRSRGGRNNSWEGGGYSRMSLGHVDMRSGVDTEADMTIPDVPPEAEKDRFITGEIERIYHFRNPSFNTEIWFVAMGCDNDSHDGVRAFINEHKSELRGSMVIEIESMGAGALSVAKREGATKKISASSRIKRYTREAVAATGISLDEVDLSGTESIASIIQKAGFQSMHLFGAENGRPALKGSADDVMENIDELVFEENTRFVYELLKR